MFVYLNGKIVDSKDANISVFDHGYLYGDGIFETMRAHNGKTFLEKEHLTRMKKAAVTLGLPFDPKSLSGAIQKTLRKNKLDDAYVRASISRGVGETGINSKCGKPTVLVIAKQINADKNSSGISCSTVVQDYHNPLNSKSLSFLNYVLARRASKADEVILLNTRSEVREGSISNVFILKEGVVLTPPVDGIVDGITRRLVIRLCKRARIPVKEKAITKKDLLSADECFITNSIKGIVPVASIDGQTIPTGETTGVLAGKYRKLTDSI